MQGKIYYVLLSKGATQVTKAFPSKTKLAVHTPRARERRFPRVINLIIKQESLVTL